MNKGNHHLTAVSLISSCHAQEYSPIDSQVTSSGIADVAVVLDNSIYTYEDEQFMLQASQNEK